MATTELTALSPGECWRRLRSVPVGRLAYTEHALPAIRPVNFTVQDDQVLIWSRPGGKTNAIRGQVVAFEVDEIDPDCHIGWSVVVLGKVEVVTGIDELVRLATPSAPGCRDRSRQPRRARGVGHRVGRGVRRRRLCRVR